MSATAVDLRVARRPSPAAVRRRRAVALAGLAALLALPVALLAGRPGAPDTREITSLLTRGSAAPATLCDDLSAGMLRAIGGHEACLRTSPARGPAGRVHDVRVSGATARAVVTSSAGDEVVRLVREGGAWKVDDVR